MRILVIHQYYLLSGWPGGSRFNEMARAWSEYGHDVTVVAGVVDYLTGAIPDRYRGRWIVREQDGPVSVWRCYVPHSYSRSYIGRGLAFVAFMVSASTAVLAAGRHDVVIATSPPLLAAVPGWIAARWRWRPVPWVFEVRDLWPESAITTGVLRARSLSARLLYRIERWACRSASRINVLTPAFAADIVRRGLAGTDKILFVPNGADTRTFVPSEQPCLRQELGWSDRFVVLYAGAHGRANAIGQLVAAAGELKDRPDILIATVGDGPERHQWARAARDAHLFNIVFLGARPKGDMPRLVSAADAGVAVLQDNPTFKTVYPNKVFDYMAAARPVILAVDGAIRQVICEEAHAGIFAPPEQPKALAAAIRGLADDPAAARRLGRNGRAWVLSNASRGALAARYLTLLTELAAPIAERAAAHPGIV